MTATELKRKAEEEKWKATHPEGEEEEEGKTPSQIAKEENPWWHEHLGLGRVPDLSDIDQDRAQLREDALDEVEFPWLTTIVFFLLSLLMVLNDFVSKATDGGDLPMIGKPVLGSHALADSICRVC